MEQRWRADVTSITPCTIKVELLKIKLRKLAKVDAEILKIEMETREVARTFLKIKMRNLQSGLRADWQDPMRASPGKKFHIRHEICTSGASIRCAND